MKKRLLAILVIMISAAVFTPADVSAQVTVERSKQQVTHGDNTFLLHTVKRGQTLFSIAKAYYISEEAIIYYNPFAADGIKARQSLLIPTEKTYKAWKAGQKQRSEAVREEPSPVPSANLSKDRDVQRDRDKDHERQMPVISGKKYDLILPPDSLTGKGDEEVASLTKPFDGSIKPPNRNSPINVALLLPFKSSGAATANENFSDFYKGVLIALNSLKNEGISVNLDLMSSMGTADQTAQLIHDGKLGNANLIIGPVYAEEFAPVARFAENNRIPLVSPLGEVNAGQVPYVFQVAPTENTKYEKLRGVINNPENNVFVIRDMTDQNAYNEMRSVIPDGIRSVDNSKEAISSMLIHDVENVIIVPVSNETAVEGILSRLSSIKNMTPRYKITVIGTPRWARFNNLNLDLFFRLNVNYVTSYHADRSNPMVHEFYRQYIEAFGALPSLYSFRGYDVARYFITALNQYGEWMPRRIVGHNPDMLQVKYNFRQEDGDRQSKFINREWMLVKYLNNYDIEVQ